MPKHHMDAIIIPVTKVYYKENFTTRLHMDGNHPSKKTATLKSDDSLSYSVSFYSLLEN